MKKLFTVACFVIFLSNISFAQKDLGFEFDYARFNYDTTAVYMEMYYELSPNNMQAVKTEKGLLLEAIVHFELKNVEKDTFFVNKDWKIQSLLSTSDSTTSKTLTGSFGLVIPAGKYLLKVKAYDSQNASLSKSISESLNIVPFKTNKFSISDIELASNIKVDDVDTSSIFYKNTLEVIPNPSMVFSSQSPVLFYYDELYGLKKDSAAQSFSFVKQLYNSGGTQVYKNVKEVKQNPNAVVDYGLINLSKLPTDAYNLVFSLIDKKTNEAFVSTKRFYLFNANVKDTTSSKKINAGVYTSEFGVMSKEECDNMFNAIKYIASNNEIKQYKALDSLNAKQTFLYNFWKNRDKDPSTDRNEYKEEYMRNVDFANENFTVGGKQGYLTDRGRVLLYYGTPDQKDFYSNESNMKPYEAWFYNQIEGGVEFVFGDLTGFGDFMLLHSTKRGEISDSNWKSRLSTDAKSSQ